jgi:hypothetical protein
MTVDIRAKVICDLGEVISGGWSDDHVQGTGLIRTRGELVLKGLVRTTLGQTVQLAYVQNGYASRFPRALRVLGAFADPFRRQTTIQLGCLLTLRENLGPQLDIEKTADTWDDPENSNIVCNVFADGATISISAAYVASLCATRLGLGFPDFSFLTNWYTVEQFDLTPGYANVLSDLLVSECYVGFLDASETLQIRSLLDFTGTYTVISQDRVIDIGPINSGDIPGDSVATSYSYKRFVVPELLDGEDKQIRDWERDETIGPAELRLIEHDLGVYSRVVVPITTVVTNYDKFDRVISRIETTKTHVCVTNPAYVKWFAGEGKAYNDFDDYLIKETYFNYESPADELAEPPNPPPGFCSQIFSAYRVYDPERDNKILSEITTTYQSEMAIAGALNIPEYSGDYTTPAGGSSQWEFQPSLQVDVVTEIVQVIYEKDEESGITKTITTTQQAQALTQSGQQVGALEAEDGIEQGDPVTAVIHGKNLVNLGTVISTRTDREYGIQRRPSRSERNNNANTKSAVEAVSSIAFVYGLETSENVTSYSLPYAPDDRIGFNEETFKYVLVSESDAEVKARNYGRAQNGLAFGHRNGFSIQLAAPETPPYSLDRIRIDAAGYGSGYVCNGTSWSFDSNGIVCNTDALFVGGIGSTELGGSLWFAVQPGITLLGPAPEIYENEYAEPANSIPVDESFDPLNPPLTFWTEDLPKDTPAIPAEESEVDQLVPAWREEIEEDFAVRSTIRVTRGIVSIPTVQPVSLVTRTAVNVLDLRARILTLPVRSVVTVSEAVPAIRADLLTAFCVLSSTSLIVK